MVPDRIGRRASHLGGWALTMSETETTDDENEPERTSQLNLTAEEGEVLWEMLKHGIGREKWQDSDGRSTAESIHTKVKKIADSAGND